MNRIGYLNSLLDTLMNDMRVPMGARHLTDIASPVSLNKGTYVWRLEPAFHNTVSYQLKLNHAASGAAGSFKFIAYDDKRTPGRPDMRSESAVMSKNIGQTSDWIFNNYEQTVFVGIEILNDNTQILLTPFPPPGFRALNPFWLKGGVSARGSDLQPGAVGDLSMTFVPPDQDLGERYPGLQIAPSTMLPSDLTKYYHVDFGQLNTDRIQLDQFCSDLLQHFLDHYPAGNLLYDQRAAWRRAHPNATERQYLDYLLRRLIQQPLNFPDPPSIPERLTHRFRTNFIAPEAFDGSGADFGIEMLQHDLAGRNVPFLTGQEWENGYLRRTFPENFIVLQTPLQRSIRADTAALEGLRQQIAVARQILSQHNTVQLILEVLDRAFELDLVLDRGRAALTRNETGIAEAAFSQAESNAKFLIHHNYALTSDRTTSEWAQALMAEDLGAVNVPPLRQQLNDRVLSLARRNRGNTLANIASLLQPGAPFADDLQPADDYVRRLSRSPAQIDLLAADVRFVPSAHDLEEFINELLEKNGNYEQLSQANKTIVKNTVVGLWTLIPHYVHLQLPLLYAELQRLSGRYDAARHFLEIVLDDDDAGPSGMVRYPFLNPIEIPAVTLRLARYYREHGDLLLRSLDPEVRVFAGHEYDRARRLLMLATKPDNPSAQMEIAACDVGVHKIQHRLNIFGFAEDFVPRFRYQQMITLAGELAQQALEAGRQLIGFWQQAEQAQRAELETSQVVALNGAMVEAEELRVEEAKAMSAIADLQVQQTARQITDLNARIGELSDPVFFWAAFATGVQSGLGFFATGAALGGPIGTLVGVVSGGGAGSAGGPAGIAAGAAGGGAIGGLAGGVLGIAAGGYLAYAQGAAQWKAHESNLNDQKRSKTLLEDFGTAIAAAQQQSAKTQELIAERMAEIARLRLSQSQEIAALLHQQFFNSERFYQLADQMREIYRSLLGHAMRVAFIAEQALEFELDERVNVIGYDYDRPGDNFLLGGESLRSDLATLRTQRLERLAAKRLPGCINISLAEEFPLALFELRTIGKTTIRPDLAFLDRLYPGAYQARISRIELLFFALTPQVGLHGTVKSSGLSFVKNGNGQATALILPPETMLISRYQYRDGGMYFALPEEQLQPFEGFGMATDFTLELPAIANNFERQTIADVHVIVHFTALHSDTLEAQVKAQRQVNSVTMRSFSMHDALSDAYFDLVNTQNATFTLGAQHFPRTHGNPTILRVMLLTVLDQESVADAVNWQIDYTDRAGANRQLKVVTIRSNPTVDLGAGPSLAGMSAFGTWKVNGSLADAADASIALEKDLLDLALFIEYKFQQL